jgi:ADP-ribose pyrophosphatase YjhB (NUDIX family)
MSELIPCVGGIVINPAGFLLVVQRKNEPARGLWSLPGGRVEPGETAEAAVVREVAEETGIVALVNREVGTVQRAAPGGGIYDIRDFLMFDDSERQPLAADDALDVRYVTPAQLRDLPTSPGLIEALTEWGIMSSGADTFRP